MRNHGLSVVLLAFFLITAVAHSIAGWKADNEERQQHGDPPQSYTEFLASAEFSETVFENWESEFLQMAFYVVFTVFLRQKGSAESKKIDEKEEVDEDPEEHRTDPEAPWPVRRGGFVLALYKNSLSLALFALFLFSFFMHARAGAARWTEEAAEHGQGFEPMTVWSYLCTSRFWYESMQNWQSEFLAVLAIVVLSIHLRQYGSPESKPVHASHAHTGKD